MYSVGIQNEGKLQKNGKFKVISKESLDIQCIMIRWTKICCTEVWMSQGRDKDPGQTGMYINITE